MNIFRLGGDLAHVASFYLLIQQILKTKSVAGISLKTQYLYALVYVTRYLDLLYGIGGSFYNFVMKIIYLGTSFYIIYLMTNKFKPTHNPNIDTFKVHYLLWGCFICSLIFNLKFSFSEILWAFSIWLESVSILPQLFIIQRTGEAEGLTVHYVFALGIYRGLYVLNWVWKWFVGDRFDWVSVVAGIIQTGLYSDFFYLYYTKVMQGKKFELPQ